MAGRTGQKPRVSGQAGKGNQTVALIIAIVLIVAAGAVVLGRHMSARAEQARVEQASNPQVQVQQIQSNTNMPPQAKEMALQQMRAHMGETQSRSASLPQPGR